jgi:hypothetical protein
VKSCGLAVEAVAELRISGEGVRQDLDRNGAIQARVAGFVDLAHPAGPDGGEDFGRTESRASRDRHFFSPAGTFCFSSSDQLSTTLICVGAANAGSLGFIIKKRWPSRETS